MQNRMPFFSFASSEKKEKQFAKEEKSLRVVILPFPNVESRLENADVIKDSFFFTEAEARKPSGINSATNIVVDSLKFLAKASD